MQNYVEVTEDTPIKDSREQFLANDKTIASHYAGEAFPVANLLLGMECFRTDENKKYRLTSLEPVMWEIIPGAVDLPIKAGKNIKVTKNATTKAVTIAVNGTVDNAKYANAAWYLLQNEIAADTDLNSVQDEGGYICLTNDLAKTLLNSPTQEAFGMYVENTGVGVIQILKKYNTASPGMLFRNFYDGVWSEWKQIATADSKVAAASTADHAGTADTAKACTGNAATATRLQTARKINGLAFDGTQDIEITARANGGDAATVGGHPVENAANGIPVYNAVGHLVLPSGAEFWME